MKLETERQWGRFLPPALGSAHCTLTALPAAPKTETTRSYVWVHVVGLGLRLPRATLLFTTARWRSGFFGLATVLVLRA